MYAIYENKGTLDMRALTMMGVNSKPASENPIGYFGTGLKYAVAVLARMGCVLTVQDGNGRQWTTKAFTEDFRDKSFTMLRLVGDFDMNDIELPFTTELGKNWELWMAMRELECNMSDEDGHFTLIDEYPVPKKGTIRFIVSGDAYIQCCRDMRSQVFFDVGHPNAVKLSDSIVASAKPSRGVYYRGILVHTAPSRQFAYAYNVLNQMDLTEDRTLKYLWDFENRIESLFVREGNAEWRQRLLDDLQAQEWECCNFSSNPDTYDKEALQQIEDHYLRGREMHQSMDSLIKRMELQKEYERDMELMDDHTAMLEEAKERIELLGYSFDGMTISVKQKLPNNALGQADIMKKAIYVSGTNFEMGLECLMGTLLEEHAHIAHGFRDHSREFQDWLLRQAIVQGQRYLRKVKRDGRD